MAPLFYESHPLSLSILITIHGWHEPLSSFSYLECNKKPQATLELPKCKSHGSVPKHQLFNEQTKVAPLHHHLERGPGAPFWTQSLGANDLVECMCVCAWPLSRVCDLLPTHCYTGIISLPWKLYQVYWHPILQMKD